MRPSLGSTSTLMVTVEGSFRNTSFCIMGAEFVMVTGTPTLHPSATLPKSSELGTNERREGTICARMRK